MYQTKQLSFYQRIKLMYIGKMDVPGYKGDLRLWNVIAPKLDGYNYTRGYPTLTIQGLKENNIL